MKAIQLHTTRNRPSRASRNGHARRRRAASPARKGHAAAPAVTLALDWGGGTTTDVPLEADKFAALQRIASDRGISLELLVREILQNLCEKHSVGMVPASNGHAAPAKAGQPAGKCTTTTVIVQAAKRALLDIGVIEAPLNQLRSEATRAGKESVLQVEVAAISRAVGALQSRLADLVHAGERKWGADLFAPLPPNHVTPLPEALTALERALNAHEYLQTGMLFALRDTADKFTPDKLRNFVEHCGDALDDLSANVEKAHTVLRHSLHHQGGKQP